MYYEIITNGQKPVIRVYDKTDALRIARNKETDFNQTVSIVEVLRNEENLIYQTK